MRKINLFLIIIGFSFSVFNAVAASSLQPKEYVDWLNVLKKEMIERGISEQTVQQAFAKDYYHPRHQVVQKDRSQTEFVLKTSNYLKRVVSPLRIKQGQKHYQQLKKQYPHGLLNVPLHYLVAFWGIETNFGMHKGGYPAIEALTVLSYDKRRARFFREELYNALKILDEKHISLDKMESSWAGAMGHFQFMPSTFNHYGKDADNDGQKDIWHNFNDAVLSAANYLTSIGWKKDEPWGMPVELSWNFDYSQTGRHRQKSVKEWKKLGVVIENAKDEWQGAVIVPEGHRGQAYLILSNFHIIMQWNKSENYALAVGLLADCIKQGKKALIIKQANNYTLTRDDVKKIQHFANRQKLAHVDEDGALGSKTKEAIQKVQQKFKLPPDGYPDYRLLQDIKNFPQNGYHPPVPTEKLHSIK